VRDLAGPEVEIEFTRLAMNAKDLLKPEYSVAVRPPNLSDPRAKKHIELYGPDWPEPRQVIEPVWNAERKDELENRLHALVCNGDLDIEVAQKSHDR
jgi:hypothetical protein